MSAARSNRFVVMLTDDELTAIDDFRFGARMSTKAGAVRQLILEGLNSHKTNGPASVAALPGRGSSISKEEKANEHGNR